jgi:hypothetical protein
MKNPVMSSDSVTFPAPVIPKGFSPVSEATNPVGTAMNGYPAHAAAAFQRAGRAGGVSSGCGEDSSGSSRGQGGITKAGNVHLRKLLVESSWHYRYPASASAGLIRRRTSQDAEVIAYADRAMTRLQKKLSRLVNGKSKRSQVAGTAVARELADFAWGLMAGNAALGIRGGMGVASGMERECRTVKENPRRNCKAPPCGVILGFRVRKLPMDHMSCFANYDGSRPP